jgi:hypothetical protein
MNRPFFRYILILAVVCTCGFIGYSVASEAKVIIPQETIRLFNGKDLSPFYTWLEDLKHQDPDRVFSIVDQIDGAPAIRISGERWGALVTKVQYAQYRLVAEFRWGLLTWAKRKDRARDNGVLVHGQGLDGNRRSDFNDPWMRSIEAQIIEGGVGDFLVLGGYEPDGRLISPAVTAPVSKDRDGEPFYDSVGNPTEFNTGRINWYGRDVDWKDVLGFRGKQDVESPLGQWTRIEVICDKDRITYLVNGKSVNRVTQSSLTHGKILIQSEGAEIYFRRIDLEPLK